MNDRNLEPYAERLNALKPYILSQAKGNPDLIQEQYLGVLLALKENPSCSDSYLRTRARWNMLNYLRPSISIEDRFTNVSDIFPEVFTTSLDEYVMGKLLYEELFTDLSLNAKKYIHYRLLAYTNSSIAEKMGLSHKELREIQNEIKFKFNHYFSPP